MDRRDLESEYVTMGGWAIEMLETFPKPGDSFTYKNLKVTVLETCPTSARETMDLLSGPLHAEQVQVIGRKIALYRRQSDPEKRRIVLPKA